MSPRSGIPHLFISNFKVDERTPFSRYLNRLEVEIGKEDYRSLKRVELLPEPLPEDRFSAMEEITGRILQSTQNHYNRDLLLNLGIRIYLDQPTYCVYYRCPDRTVCFHPHWRELVLRHFLPDMPTEDSGWRNCEAKLPGFEIRFLPDNGGGALLLRSCMEPDSRPLLTATHGPYDPHTLEVTLLLLASGHASGAIINLGFAGREPLTDQALDKLQEWGIPLNPSNIDVIYPYTDAEGQPNCYKMERNLGHFVTVLDRPLGDMLLDIHGCVGSNSEDSGIIVGLGGLPPFPDITRLGRVERQGRIVHLFPSPQLKKGLLLVRELSDRIFLQFCCNPDQCFNFAVLGKLQMIGRQIDPRQDTLSLLEGEERTYLPKEEARWLPGAGANALQRVEGQKLNPNLLCMHVEIPTRIRRLMVIKYRELQIDASLASSSL